MPPAARRCSARGLAHCVRGAPLHTGIREHESARTVIMNGWRRPRARRRSYCDALARPRACISRFVGAPWQYLAGTCTPE